MNFQFVNKDFAYTLHKPANTVKDVVSYYCDVTYTHEQGYIEREILPFPGNELAFCLEGSVFVRHNQMPALPSACLFGQSTTLKKLLIGPKASLFIIMLKQHFLKSYLHDKTNWNNYVFQLRDKFTNVETNCLETILTTHSLSERIEKANTAFSLIIQRQPDENYQWLKSIDNALQKEMTVDQSAKATFISVRQLERKFKAYFGLPPAEYIRLCKLSTAIDHYARNIAASATESSYKGGFTDQAHFIKIFQSYCHQPPFKFFRKHNIKNKG